MSPAYDQSRGDNRDASEAYLIDLTTTFIDLMNARAYGSHFFTQHVSHDVFVDLQGHKTVGLDGFLGNYKKDADAAPNFHVDIINSSAEVDEDKGRATVILSQELSGYGVEEKKMAGTILMSWERKRVDGEGSRAGGQWICKSVCMMFGTPEFLV